MTSPEYILLGSSVAWSVLWAQFAVIPFFNHVETNAWVPRRDLAFIKIDGAKTIPALARLFDKISRELAAGGKKASLMGPEGIMAAWDLQIHLMQAEEAAAEKQAIQAQMDQLAGLSSRIWKCGATHIVLIISAALTAVALGPNESRDALVYGAGGAALLALLYTVALILRYERGRQALTQCFDRYHSAN